MTRRTFLNRLRPFVALLLGIAIIPLVAAPSFAQEKEQRDVRTLLPEARAQQKPELCKLPGQRVEKTFHKRMTIAGLPDPLSFERKYVVYVPSTYNQAEKLPLVMVLHGCLEIGSGKLPLIETIESDTQFDVLAEKERFIVVYPNHRLDWTSGGAPFCWEWWVDSNIHEGRGEVADLAGIIKEVQHDYNKVDPDRIHITGISSGGAMTVAALVAYSEIFASGSPTAGMPYSETEMNFLLHRYKPVDAIAAAMTAEMGSQKRPVPILIIQSEADTVVNPEYAENIRDSWGRAFRVDTRQPSASTSGETKGTGWTHNKYGGSDVDSVVETLILHRRSDGGLDHGWYGDGEARYAFPNAPDTAEIVWKFFKAHPRNPAPASTSR